MMLLLISGSLLAQDALPKPFVTEDDFTIHLPWDWEQIPKEVIDKFIQDFTKMAPSAPKMHYDYVFQKSSNRWFQYPYVLVQVNNNGKIPESQLKSYDKFEDEMNKNAKKLETHTYSALSDIEVGKTYYDPSCHILWSQMESNVEGAGKVRALIAMILTERGTIQIFGYSLAKDYDRYAPLFEKIARNVIVSGKIRYKPPADPVVALWDNISNHPYFKYIAVALLGGTIGFLGFLKSRKRPKKGVVYNDNATKDSDSESQQQ